MSARACIARSALALVAAALVSAAVASALAAETPSATQVQRSAFFGDQLFRFAYRTHDGKPSYALLLLPSWYGPGRHPRIPLVICPHGRNTEPESAATRWNELPTLGGFAVVLPAGQGRVLRLSSWGYPGQIADLARMPALAERAVPFFRHGRVYAVGASMGGQEALLLLAQHPRLLSGVVAFDPAVDLADRYREFPYGAAGVGQQARARLEVGGTPEQVPQAYRERSPDAYTRQIALSSVPVQLWWSSADNVIVDQAQQVSAFFEQLVGLNPAAPIATFGGDWPHATEDSALADLPVALVHLGLLPAVWRTHNPLLAAQQHVRPGGSRPA